MSKARHVLVNALSVGGGGGVTVARELANHLGRFRPDCTFTVAINPQNSLQRELGGSLTGHNVKAMECPGTTGVLERARYEKRSLIQWSLRQNVNAVLQLNGMLIPGMPIPTLAHCQNPFPYQPLAWNGWRDRMTSFLKRRAQARSLPRAAFVGWTSGYLRDLICGWLGIKLDRNEVFYNGVPDDWMKFTDSDRSSLQDRPMEILTVSNVAVYKRQELMIRALPLLVSRPGLQTLVYRIVGAVSAEYRDALARLASDMGVGDRVHIEGRIDDALVADRYQRARCFVFMSVCESFGIPAVEAMSFGTPVVVSDACAFPETCGEAAEYVPPDDVRTLADVVHRVLTQSARSHDLRVNGFKRVQHFSWRASASRMADVLDEIAGPA